MEPIRLNSALLIVTLSVTGFALFMGCGDSDSETETETNVVREGIDPYCDTRPQFDFCEDFDQRELPGVFDEQIIELGEMTITDEDASSAPSSLEITVQPGGTGALRHQFGPGGKLRLFGMLYIAQLGEGEVEIGAFESGDYRVGFGVSADGSLWAHESGNRLEAEGTIPVGRWASFRWDVNLYGDGTGSAKLRFGNDYIVNTEALMAPMEAPTTPAASFGLSESTGTWTMRFDNVTVSVKEFDE